MTLHVEASGSGRDLVLLHGWGMRGAVWCELALALAPDFRVHCVDLPGHGASRSSKVLNADAWCEALAAAVPAPAIVCGWSLGAQLALKWAERSPRSLEHLVLIATTPCFVNGPDWPHGIDAEVFDAFTAELARDPRAVLQRFLALQAQGDAQAREVLRRLRRMIGHGTTADVAALRAALRLLGENDLRALLPRVAQPALLIHGAQDALVPLQAGRYLQQELPGATLAVIAGAAHAPFITREREIARMIAEFCCEQ